MEESDSSHRNAHNAPYQIQTTITTITAKDLRAIITTEIDSRVRPDMYRGTILRTEINITNPGEITMTPGGRTPLITRNLEAHITGTCRRGQRGRIVRRVEGEFMTRKARLRSH
jgi:hypothetical protein